MSIKSLQGKVAIVTGGSRGIGRAIALEFAANGAKAITITYASNKDAAAQTVADIESHGSKGLALQASGTTIASADEVVHTTLTTFGVSGIDILINNAASMAVLPLEDVTPEIFHATYSLNVLAPLLYTRSIMPVINRKGRIVNISSRAARHAFDPTGIIYAGTKAALEHQTRLLASGHAATNLITINNVMPGGTATDIIAHAPPHLVESVKNAATAEKRLGQPEEIANVVRYLCEDGGARWINGATINVTGGASMW